MTDEPRRGEEREFEDLTLAEAAGDLLRQPLATVRRLLAVTDSRRSERPMRVTRPLASAPDGERAGISVSGQGIRAALLVTAFLLAAFGNMILFQPGGGDGTRVGLLRDVPILSTAIWWALSALLVVVALRFTNAPVFEYEDEFRYDIADSFGLRLWALVAAVPLLALAFFGNRDNTFTVVGVAGWIGGTALMAWAFTPQGINPLRTLRGWGGTLVSLPRRHPQIALALVLIFMLAAYARFNGLSDMPADMTSDHIEKALDSQRVVDGSRDIFFANNGGREPFQMYFIALLAELSGGQVTFDHLKVAAAIESLAGVMMMFVLGYVAVGERDRRTGVILGLVLALLAAVGYWHLAITRVSLRIMLTPLVTTVFIIFLMRFIRHNRREDAVMLGLTIGFGLYSYQALRILPVVAVVAVLYQLIFTLRSNGQRMTAIMNLFVMALVSFAVFVPMFRYSTEHPDDFWRRAQGRMLGDDVITETLEDGSIMNRSPTIGERVSAFMENVPLLGQNLVRALGMFTYRGDVAWLHNAPNYPTFDPIMGGLLIMGLVSWVVWALQKRECAALFLLAILVLMISPSIVAIANPNENPSNTRASGAMPVAYLFAAYGLTRIIIALRDVVPRRFLLAVSVGLAGVIALQSLSWSNMVIFGPYDDFYRNSWAPHREVGHFMRGVAESDGAWGNVFILSAPHFYDYRGVAMEAGLKPGEFRGGDIPLDKFGARLYDNYISQGRYRLDPDRYIVIIYSVNDSAAEAQLREWFPQGRAMIVDTRIDTPWLNNKPYATFRVPPLGLDGLSDVFRAMGLPSG